MSRPWLGPNHVAPPGWLFDPLGEVVGPPVDDPERPALGKTVPVLGELRL